MPTQVDTRRLLHRFNRLVVVIISMLVGPVRAHDSPSSRSHRVQPNIVFIMADDLGYGDLSCYGASDLNTPHIDRMGERGSAFQRLLREWGRLFANSYRIPHRSLSAAIWYGQCALLPRDGPWSSFQLPDLGKRPSIERLRDRAQWQMARWLRRFSATSSARFRSFLRFARR